MSQSHHSSASDQVLAQPEDLNRLNVLHVTGTKGKVRHCAVRSASRANVRPHQGSTSAFCNSMLAKVAPKAKIGLYTSPHMVAVRERIRINGKPLPEDTFAKYFFEVWDSFERNAEVRETGGHRLAELTPCHSLAIAGDAAKSQRISAI